MKQRNWVVRTISDTLCDRAGLSWQYIVRWKPLVCRGQPWTRYGVSGYKCTAHAAACTATVCAAAMTLCLLKAGGSNVTAIAAGLPERASAVRIGTAFKPKNCLAQPISGT